MTLKSELIKCIWCQTISRPPKKVLVKVKSDDIDTDYYLIDVAEFDNQIRLDASLFDIDKDALIRRNNRIHRCHGLY